MHHSCPRIADSIRQFIRKKSCFFGAKTFSPMSVADDCVFFSRWFTLLGSIFGCKNMTFSNSPIRRIYCAVSKTKIPTWRIFQLSAKLMSRRGPIFAEKGKSWCDLHVVEKIKKAYWPLVTSIKTWPSSIRWEPFSSFYSWLGSKKLSPIEFAIVSRRQTRDFLDRQVEKTWSKKWTKKWSKNEGKKRWFFWFFGVRFAILIIFENIFWDSTAAIFSQFSPMWGAHELALTSMKTRSFGISSCIRGFVFCKKMCTK